MPNKPTSQDAILTEITPLEQSHFLFLRDSMPETFSFPLHRHEEFELNFIEHCKGRMRIVGDSIEELGIGYATRRLVVIQRKRCLSNRFAKFSHIWAKFSIYIQK